MECDIGYSEGFSPTEGDMLRLILFYRQIINTQLETDKSMAKLVKAIDDTFITLCDAKCLELHNVTSRVEMIKLIVQQTTESAVLLYDYLQTSSLCRSCFIPRYTPANDRPTQGQEHCHAP